jgi:hypothetical protein
MVVVDSDVTFVTAENWTRRSFLHSRIRFGPSRSVIPSTCQNDFARSKNDFAGSKNDFAGSKNDFAGSKTISRAQKTISRAPKSISKTLPKSFLKSISPNAKLRQSFRRPYQKLQHDYYSVSSSLLSKEQIPRTSGAEGFNFGDGNRSQRSDFISKRE